MRLIGWGDKEKAKNINEGLLGILRKAEMSKFIGRYEIRRSTQKKHIEVLRWRKGNHLTIRCKTRCIRFNNNNYHLIIITIKFHFSFIEFSIVLQTQLYGYDWNIRFEHDSYWKFR